MKNTVLFTGTDFLVFCLGSDLYLLKILVITLSLPDSLPKTYSPEVF